MSISDFPPTMIYGDGYTEFSKQWIDGKLANMEKLTTISATTFLALKREFLSDLKVADDGGVFAESKRVRQEALGRVLEAVPKVQTNVSKSTNSQPPKDKNIIRKVLSIFSTHKK